MARRYVRRGRRPRRKTVWTRSVLNIGTTGPEWETDQEVLACDLLAKLRAGTGPAEDTTSLPRVGSLTAGVSTIGATILTCHLRIVTHFQNNAGAIDPKDGIYVGAFVSTWPFDAGFDWVKGSSSSGEHDYDPRYAADSTDWMYWEYISAYQNANYATNATITSTVGVHDYRIKARRNLPDAGKTMLLCVRPNPIGTGPRDMVIAASVLLALA